MKNIFECDIKLNKRSVAGGFRASLNCGNGSFLMVP